MNTESSSSNTKLPSKSGNSHSDDGSSSNGSETGETENSSSSSTWHDTSTSEDVSKSADRSSSQHPPKAPWEEWLLKKTLQERAQTRRVRAEQLAKETEKLKLSEEQRRKEQLTAAKLKSWLATKNQETRTKLVKMSERVEVTRRTEEVKRLQLQEKSKEAYKNWTLKKLREMKESKSKLEESQREAKLMLERKRQANEVAYSDWLKASSKTPAPNYRCYGYTGGKIISWRC